MRTIIDEGPIKAQADVEESHRLPAVLTWVLLDGDVVVLKKVAGLQTDRRSANDFSDNPWLRRR